MEEEEKEEGSRAELGGGIMCKVSFSGSGIKPRPSEIDTRAASWAPTRTSQNEKGGSGGSADKGFILLSPPLGSGSSGKPLCPIGGP